ncbi:MAG: SipW-dependent-type signal peptide-containing protein [Marinisporobacter sp.]|jgi:predicted ribosomally synthesized peptide with SipW-like signal peptide|nr:SipW-dependent-type signal peptide-containing protein [Marinisporobacter sp.]
MMKKTKFLALVLAVAVMMMGAGYAAWNETVTINNTVETGEVDVALLKDGSKTEVKNEDNCDIEHAGTGVMVENNDKTSTENKATVKLTNLYPGAVVDVTIPVKNNGSIPVKLDSKGIEADTTAYKWLSVTHNAPEKLKVGQQGNITFTVTVLDKEGTNVPEKETAIFDVTANYVQFNQ